MLLCACTSALPLIDGDVVAPAELGWATRLVRSPASFSTLMEQTGRDGWVAMFEHRYLPAADLFGDHDVPVSRALLAERSLQSDLQRSTSIATVTLFDTWQTRGTMPNGDGPLIVAALAARCAGQSADRWTATMSPAAQQWFSTGLVLPSSDGQWPSIDAASALHTQAGQDFRSTQRLASWAADGAVLLREPATADSPARAWVDPCVHAGIASGLTPRKHPKDWPEDGLISSLFGSSLNAADLLAQVGDSDDLSVVGAGSAAIESTLGLSAQAPTSDDAEAARTEIRAMDLRLDALRVQLLAEADDDGRALLDQLDPLHRLRQEVLVARARRDLRAGHPERALATLMLARDVTDRSVGPRNSPALLALLTEANLRSGRAREALDALQPLVAARPEVAPLREILSDLVVLRGLDRRGDSKEH